MKRFTIPLTLLLFSCLSANEPVLATYPCPPDATSEDCGESPHPIRLALRHIEANGIGYNQGYTTIEGFFSPIDSHSWFGISNGWIPFLDLRYHAFNDGKPALNAGVGLRRVGEHVCWGMNAYYDYRKTSHQHYNQVGLGIEALGKIWDFRLNGYLPVGETESSPYAFRDFEYFQGHYLYISQKREFALKAVNAEAGIHFNEFGKSRARNTYNAKPHLYFAAGPYYLNGHGQSSWGGQARFALDIYEYIRLEANTSYDNIFHGVGQGQLTVTIPLGRKKKVTPRNGESCGRARMFSERTMQKVDRFEIIPVDHKRENAPAIDPATGEPYFFWFVNNLSHSEGTYESPFPTLAMAQDASKPYDVIYVYPGDGTDNGMSDGILLKDNQLLFGSSTPHPIKIEDGSVTIPAFTSGLPFITNMFSSPYYGSVVQLAKNNEVSGLSLHGIENTYGIFAQDIIADKTVISDCTIVSDNTFGIVIGFSNEIQDFMITDCTVSGYESGIFFFENTIGNLSIVNSTTSSQQQHGIYLFANIINNALISNCTSLGDVNGVLLSNNDVGSITVTGNILSGSVNEGISIYDNDFIDNPAITISNNTIAGGRDGLDYGGNYYKSSINISNNLISAGATLAGNGIDVFTYTDLVSFTISDCQISSANGKGINVDSVNAVNPCTISNCTITATAPSTVSFTNTPYSSSPFTLNLLNNFALGPVPNYYIDNPSPGTETFYLYRENNTGSFTLSGVTIIP